ncbi:hypothetical protein WJX74_000467 [Apatococcus lobatus]|uniref:Prolyl endopeptidase n=1 Tax=Apatococcus lobatus TaxID=904363 RepID=A0AAW1SF81_9CHLO
MQGPTGVKLEAASAASRFEGLQDLEQELKLRTASASLAERCQARERKGLFEYWTEPRERGTEFFRRHVQDGSPSQSLLNTEFLAAQAGCLLSVGEIKVSPCQQWMAYTRDFIGHGGAVACIRNMKGTLRLLAGHSDAPDLQYKAVNVEWANDGRTLVLTCPDQTGRPCQVSMLDLHHPPTVPTLVFEEHDIKHFVQLTQSKDESLIMINSHSKTASEVHLLATNQPWTNGLTCVQPRQEGLEYFVEHHQGWLYILTNLGKPGQELTLCRAPLSQPNRRHWQVVLGARAGAALEDLDIFHSCAILHWRENGHQRLSRISLDCLQSGKPGHAEGLNDAHGCPDMGWRLVQPLLHVSEAAQHTTGCTRLHTLTRASLEATANGSLRCTTLWAQAQDGTKVPVTIAYDSEQVQPPCSSPALVYAYGAYGRCLDISWVPEHQVLLEQGFVIAFAHVRGGGELGRRWHQAGCGPRKEQSILDLISCLDHLIEAGFTSPGQIGLHVTSAGGILLGNVLNRRPDLLGAGIARSPFFDLLDTMTNPEAYLTQHEYSEWGNPMDSPQALDQVRRICPYTNLSQAVEPGP